MSIIPFEFESFKFVGDYNYDTKNKVCIICNTSLYKPAPEKKEVSFVNCSISMGECKHAFHRKCIKKHLRRVPFCPFYNSGACNNASFKFSKELEMKGTIKLFKH
jgi:hypothetical protein